MGGYVHISAGGHARIYFDMCSVKFNENNDNIHTMHRSVRVHTALHHAQCERPIRQNETTAEWAEWVLRNVQ